jgi:hypothetical protein
MAAKLTRLTHKIAIQLHLVAESFTICNSRSRRPVPKLLIHPRKLKPLSLNVWAFIMWSFLLIKMYMKNICSCERINIYVKCIVNLWIYLIHVSRGSLVSVETRLLGGQRRVRFPAEAKMWFLSCAKCGPALGPNQLTIQCVPGAFTPRVKLPGHETDH